MRKDRARTKRALRIYRGKGGKYVRGVRTRKVKDGADCVIVQLCAGGAVGQRRRTVNPGKIFLGMQNGM